ncbi:MAG: sugar phosphate isomerase/epimerase [Tannerella sp.]|jgi:sugar phosphate isomerase/epimerase|nr:sugar phosphate isomerase/epimerase [Tannerella sp.]
MYSRRNFIKQASLLIAGGVIAPNILSSCKGAAKASGSSKYLGLQLYSLRDMVRDEGIRKVLETVAAMGYNSLEAASYGDGKLYGLEPTELKKIIDDLGMKLTSSHIGHNLTDDHSADMAWWNKAIEAHNAAGVKYLIMPSSPLNGAGATLDNVKRYGEYFNEIGLISAGASIGFGYHNHNFEFANKIDGVPVYDFLLENTSPDHVGFQLDVFWIKKGGYEPLDYMKKYSKRIKTLHIKDETVIGADNTVSYKDVFEQAYANGIKDWYVEVERYIGTPVEDVSESAKYLLNASFTK